MSKLNIFIQRLYHYLVPQVLVGLNTTGLAVVIVKLRKAEAVHCLAQTIIVVEELEASSNGEDYLGSGPHEESVDGAWVLDDVVTFGSDPVISVRRG